MAEVETRPSAWHELMFRRGALLYMARWCGLDADQRLDLERTRALLDQHDMAARFCSWLGRCP